MAAASCIWQIAVPAPLFRCFDYLPPKHDAPARPGVRVRVPFGKREAVGVLVRVAETSELPRSRLKSVLKVLDDEPVLTPALFKLLLWAADYYHHPVGEVLHTALPVWLRQGRAATATGARVWTLAASGRAVDPAALARTPARKKILEALRAAPDGLAAEKLSRISPRWSQAVKALGAEGWVSVHTRDCLEAAEALPTPAPLLNPPQRAAAEAIAAASGDYRAFLLHGVTGSGKTEVYLQAIEKALARGLQALVLVPEIGLTPQLVDRFRRRFRVAIAVLHSGLTDQERLCAWFMAREGKAPIVLGTRSAVFTPLKNPGLIVVDEEHDTSYKQQEGLRYSARDLAVMRAAREKIPIVLGSATPSLESLQNARAGGYALLELPDRTGVGMPDMKLLDMRRLKPAEGLSHPLRLALGERLQKGEQSLLFLNRRGFAPVWMCYGCGWVAACRRCDARFTFHKGGGRLRCHHCGAEQAPAEKCPSCGGAELHPLGEGTERVEAALAKFFPRARIERIDRDSTRPKGALEEKLARVHAGTADILIGTQMLSKGHDFPNVTLVGILNADQGLYGVDFRSTERLFQQILQVAGRSGRADKAGAVLIQTWHPDHPIFAALRRHDFHGFADYALAERRETDYPPFSHLALLRAESSRGGAALKFLREAHALAARAGRDPAVQLMEPVPAPMEKRAGRHRAQLLVQSKKRAALHAFLNDWVARLTESKLGRCVRWSLDVDPIDLY
jgi:primosomal protein N' (replication factor Y)